MLKMRRKIRQRVKMSPVLVTIEPKLCNKCMQIKNHRKEIHEYPKKKIVWTCLKCGNVKEEFNSQLNL